MVNREEVCHIILTEYDEEKFAEAMREEGKEEGRKEGREEGREEERRKTEMHIIKLYKDGIFSEETAAISLDITVDEFKELLQK